MTAFGVVLAACAPNTGVTPATSTTEAVGTSTITGPPQAESNEVVVGIGTFGSPRTLNPLLAGPDTGVLDVIAPAVFATGWYVDPSTMDPVPYTLAEIPSLANGGIVDRGDGTIDVAVRVAPGAVWEDGTPISGQDLLFTYELATDPDLPIRSDLRARYDLVVPGSMVASATGVRFRMQTSIEAELLFDIIVPRHHVEGTDFAGDWSDTMWMSGGPFRFGSFRPGQYLELVRNEAYWRTDEAGGRLPRLDRLVLRFFEVGDDVDPRLLDEFEAGRLDLVLLPDAQGNLAAYEAIPGNEVVAERAPGFGWEALTFQFGPNNRNTESLNEHRDFRRAVAHAIDRSALAGTRSTTPLSSALDRYRPGLSVDPWAEYAFDVEATATLLFELGAQLDVDLFAGDGPRLVLTTSSAGPATVAMAGEITVMLQRAGFAAELQLEDAALFFGSTLDNGTWDVAAWRYQAGPGRAAAVRFVSMFDPDGIPFVGSNFSRWGTVDSLVSDGSTERYRRIIETLRSSVDPVEIDAALQRAESILAEEVVILPILVHDEIGMAWRATELVGPELNAAVPLWNVEAWSNPAE